MVQADIAQFYSECSTWRQALRTSRNEFTQLQNRLQEMVSHSLLKENLQEVERYHNRFHIQLINIHDLKQSIKSHMRKIEFKGSANNGQLHDETVTDHETLFDQYRTLSITLQNLRQEFEQFMSRTH